MGGGREGEKEKASWYFAHGKITLKSQQSKDSKGKGSVLAPMP